MTEGRARVAIYLGRSPMPWRPDDTEAGGYPGATELAVAEVAGGLVRLDYEVTVFANVSRPCVAGGVGYRPHDAYAPADPAEALIAVNEPELFDERPCAAKTMLWLHIPTSDRALAPDRARHIDHVLAVSRWHAEALRASQPILADRIVALHNGVDHGRFSERRTRAARVVSTAQPERGLDVLLDLWPEVRAQAPGAELAYCYAPVYEYIATRNADVRAHRARIAALSRQPGVRPLGVLSQRALAELMLSSRVWAHASWASTAGRAFEETSCVGAIEAQAAGMWPVASAWGALPETVRLGALVTATGAPHDPWRAAFVEALVRGLTDSAVGDRAERDGPVAVAELSWAAVSRKVAGLIETARS